MTETAYDCIIIGAGLTGLTTAYYLKKEGKKILVLDKLDNAGGVIQSHTENGFTYESGPNTGVLSSVELVKLVDELKEVCTLEVAKPEAKSRWIWKKNKWNSLPSGPVSAIKTPLFTFDDKLRILGEPWRKKGTNPNESVAELVRRRLGKSFLNYAINPFISGIYAGNPEKLITRYALPKLYALEQNYGSFVGGAIKKKKEPKTDDEKKVSREVYSFKNGLQSFTNALVNKIGRDTIVNGALHVSISPGNKGYQIAFENKEGTKIQLLASKVVITTSANVYPSLLPFLSHEELNPITSIRHAKVVQVAVGYNKWKGIPINAFGGLMPEIENRPVLGILFPSSIFDNRAPKEGALLSVFIGGIKNEKLFYLNDDEIRELVLKEIYDTLQTKQAPDLLKIFRYEYAIPQYEINSGQRMKAIERIEKRYPGLILGGNCKDGIGMPDRVKQGVAIATRIGEK